MTNLSVFRYQSKEIRIVLRDGEQWFVAKDVCNILGLGNVSRALSRLPCDEKRPLLYHEVITLSGDPNATRFLAISKKGLRRLVASSRKPCAIELAHSLGIEVLSATREQEYLRILVASFTDQNPIEQFVVHGYQIDLYLAKANVAIECDENGHFHYDHDNEQQRERLIKQALGCSFIRFNPDAKGFNIGSVIYQIRNLIL